MALESEPQSTPLGGSNLDALKSESSNNVDLEDGEITDDDDDDAVPTISAAPTPTPSSASASGTSTIVPPISKSQDISRRESYENASAPTWMPRRLPPKPPNISKVKKSSKSSWGPPHKKGFNHDEDEDDFAVHLEKALQEKAREKAKQAVKEKYGAGEDFEEGDSCEEDDNGSQKRRKRKSRDDEGDREHKRKKLREGGNEEEDMICVRGGSPHHNPSHSPPYRFYDRSYDSYGEEDEEFDESPDRGGDGGYAMRGRGRGGKFIRGRGRGRMTGSNDCGRGGFLNKRGSKRGNSRGLPGKPQRLLRQQDTVCIYFMQGKCPKDADECQYSHDAMPRRKMELCKFYNMNCCAKREKCLYMHKDFPCKFFHTGRRCDSGDNCRFSHDKLTDVTRSVLLKHIELAPKEILGEFRRLSREQANQIIDRAARLRSEGREPEGLDLLSLRDEGGYDSGDDRPHTPMPSSPGEAVQIESESRRIRGDDSNRKRDYHDFNRDRERNRNDGFGNDRKEHRERREHRERKKKRRWDNPDDSPSQLFKLQEALQRQLQEQDDEDKPLDKNLPNNPSWANEDVFSLREEESKTKTISKDSKSGPDSLSAIDPDCDNSSSLKRSPKDEAAHSGKVTTEANAGESGEESQDSSGMIPSHLPKRQRELFLRIQHQQREAEHNEDSKAGESDDDVAAQDDWYSSDEDGPTSLADVLKNLKQGQKETEKDAKTTKEDTKDSKKDGKETKSSSSRSGQWDDLKADQQKESIKQPARRPPLLPTPTILTDLMKNSAIDQLLSTIRYGPTSQSQPNATSVNPAQAENTSSMPVGLESPVSKPVLPVRDPRLSRDPRGRSSSLVGTSPSSSPSTDPRLDKGDSRDPRSERRDPRADPRPDTNQCPLDSLASPRSEQRGDFRQADPRAAKTESRRTSEGSSSSTGINVNQQSIYDNANQSFLSGSGDVDLRIKNDSVGDKDFRTQNSQLGAGDMDMRRDLPGSTAFRAHDTDLRFSMSHSKLELEGDYASASHNDLDLRRIQMMLPFKPLPDFFTPATEINASLSSHTPGPYHVVVVDIPKPDFSGLKLPEEDQVKSDPRLRRLLGVNRSEAHAISTPVSPPLESPPKTSNTSAPPAVARSDPRLWNSSSRPADPRQSRMGASGCPPTPRADDHDEPTIGDTDLRFQAAYGRQQSQWEPSASSRGRGGGLLPHPEAGWSPFGHRLSHPQSHPYHGQHGSFTPPPT